MVHFSRPITAATAIFTLISSIAASPIELHLPKVLEARQDGSLPVVGVTSGGVQPRLELRELEKQHEQFTLFIIALTRFQAVDQNDRESYYQIAGQFSLCLHSRGGTNTHQRHSWTAIRTLGWCRN